MHSYLCIKNYSVCMYVCTVYCMYVCTVYCMYVCTVYCMYVCTAYCMNVCTVYYIVCMHVFTSVLNTDGYAMTSLK